MNVVNNTITTIMKKCGAPDDPEIETGIAHDELYQAAGVHQDTIKPLALAIAPTRVQEAMLAEDAVSTGRP